MTSRFEASGANAVNAVRALVTVTTCAFALACATALDEPPARKGGTAGRVSGATAGSSSGGAGQTGFPAAAGGVSGSNLSGLAGTGTAPSGTAGLTSGSGGTGVTSSIGSGVSLPFSVDDEFNPSGFMGEGAFDGAALSITPSEATPDASCGGNRSPVQAGDCHKVTWTPVTEAPSDQPYLAGWVGIYWQRPNNNWASSGRPANQIEPGATAVTFYARGASGGEKVAFFVGEYAGDEVHVTSTGEYGNDGMGTPEELTSEWTEYSIDMAGVDYAAGLYGVFGFYASVDDNAAGVEFYVDAIRWQ